MVALRAPVSSSPLNIVQDTPGEALHLAGSTGAAWRRVLGWPRVLLYPLHRWLTGLALARSGLEIPAAQLASLRVDSRAGQLVVRLRPTGMLPGVPISMGLNELRVARLTGGHHGLRWTITLELQLESACRVRTSFEIAELDLREELFDFGLRFARAAGLEGYIVRTSADDVLDLELVRSSSGAASPYRASGLDSPRPVPPIAEPADYSPRAHGNFVEPKRPVRAPGVVSLVRCFFFSFW